MTARVRKSTTPRERLEALVWKHTPKDYKGTTDTGVRTVLHLSARHGTTVTPIASLTDLQLRDKLPTAVRTEIYGPDPATVDDRIRRAHALAAELGHLALKQGCSYECSRCGASGSTPRNYVTDNVDPPQGPIFTDRCEDRGRGRTCKCGRNLDPEGCCRAGCTP